MKLIRLAAALAALLLAGVAHADDVVLSCTPPTKNTDGSTLTNLAGYRFFAGTSPTTLSQTAQVANPAQCGVTITGLAPGTWYFAVVAYNSLGVESAQSNVVARVVTAPPPSPVPAAPTSLVAAGRQAFTIKQTADRVSVVVVGTVPADTACAADNGVFAGGKVYFRVPAAAVTWSGSVRSVVVLADCS